MSAPHDVLADTAEWAAYWDAFYDNEQFANLVKPGEEVIAFARTLREAGARTILDHGCGAAARHTAYLAAAGYEVTGFDISPRAVEMTRQRMDAAGLGAKLDVADMRALPYPDATFDGLLSRGVITHGTAEDLDLSVNEVARVLRPGGLALLTFICPDSSLFGVGERIDDHTWKCVNPEDPEFGGIHHFVTAERLAALTSPWFEDVSVERYVHPGVIDTGRPYVSAHWIYVGRRLDQ
jgi:SAM-dependent methyltransferase